MHLGETLLRSAEANPNRISIYYRDQKYDFASTRETVLRLASQISRLGVSQGDRVAVLLDNSPEFIYAYFAALLAGAVVVPTNTFLVNPEIDFIYRDSRISLLITSDKYAARLTPVASNWPELRGVITVAGDSEAGGAAPNLAVPVHDFGALVAQGAADDRPSEGIDPKRLAVLQYTSGTTGNPKGVMLSHRNLVTNGEAICKATKVMQDDRFLMVLPAFHTFSQTVCVIAAALSGTAVCIVPKIDRAELGFSLMTHRPTVFPGVPALFHMLSMAPAPPPDKNSVRLYISGGAPLPAVVQQRFEDNVKKPIYEGYGLTEASPVVSWNLPGQNRPGTVGKPIHGVEVSIVNDQGHPLPTGDVGEICVRADSVMLGYFNSPKETSETIVDGWLRTGDIGHIDAEGYITIVERKKELIIHKGMNVYPTEIEAVLLRRPEIAEAAVVGAYDDAHGEVPEAFIVFHAGQSVSESDLRSLCRENLAAYKIPRRFNFAEQLPKTSTGKIKKAELRAGLQARGRSSSAV